MAPCGPGMCLLLLVAGAARGIGLGIAAWLRPEQGGLVSGQEFIVDGGLVRRMIYRG